MRRRDRELSIERAKEILNEVTFATIMTADQEGQPYGVPINPVVDGDSVYFHCATVGRKLDNIKANPKVSLSGVLWEEVTKAGYSVFYESVYMEGTAFFVEEEAEKIRILQLLCKRYISDDVEAHIAYMQPHLAHTTLCGIKITNISAKGNIPKER